MSERELTAGLLAAIAASAVRPAIFAEAEVWVNGAPDFVRCWTGVGNYSWDGKTWRGSGRLLGLTVGEESKEIKASMFQISLSGQPSDLIATALASIKNNRPGKLWLGLFEPRAYLSLPGSSGNYANTPDSTANSITGDIDIRMKVALNDWTPAAPEALLNKNTDSTQVSYRVDLLATTGTLRLSTSPDGTLANRISADSTVAVSAVDGTTKWVRITLDVNDDAGNRVYKFYTSDDGKAWTQLGATVTVAGITSIFDGTAPLAIGAINAGTSLPVSGKIYYAEVRNGIDGPVVAKFDPLRFNGQALTAQADTGEVWTIHQSGSPAAQIVAEPAELLADPYPLRRGLSSRPIIVDDPKNGTCMITIEYRDRRAALEIPHERRYTSADQATDFPNDKGFDYVEALQDTTFNWPPR